MGFLSLTRRVGESILIGSSIRIRVGYVRGGQVRLHIEAPSDLKIYREEIAHRILREYMLKSAIEKENDEVGKYLHDKFFEEEAEFLPTT